MKDLYLLEGTAISADRAPQDANCEPMSFTLVTLHAILMVMGWGFFLQFGAFIARYFRHRAPLWFRLHQLFQVRTFCFFLYCKDKIILNIFSNKIITHVLYFITDFWPNFSHWWLCLWCFVSAV